jgi:hypothetical protein
MRKVVSGLALLCCALTLACFLHCGFAGIVPPYPDPTPEQAEHERYHLAVSGHLMTAAGLSFVALLATGLIAVVLTVVGKWRSRTVDSHEG